MIVSFKHRGLKRFFLLGDASRLPQDMINRIDTLLTKLHASATIQEMDMHSYHLHELKGDRKGTWSVTVRANWRMTFGFENGQAFDVNFEDYH